MHIYNREAVIGCPTCGAPPAKRVGVGPRFRYCEDHRRVPTISREAKRDYDRRLRGYAPSGRTNPLTFACRDCGRETTSYLDGERCAPCRKLASLLAADPDWQPGRKTLRVRPCIRCGVDVVCRAARVLCPPCKADAVAEHNRKKGSTRTGITAVRSGQAIHELRSRLLESYGGRCGICRFAIDATLRWPHPLCLTLDHIHPLSAGGADTEDNLWPAHRRCNEEKGADIGYRPWADSALFGVTS